MCDRPACLTHAASPTLLAEAVAEATRRIPPLWDLRSYVAVNPFLAFSGANIADAAGSVRSGLGAEVFPPLFHYRERWAEGRLAPADLARAGARHGLDPALPQRVLEGRCSAPTTAEPLVLTFAERIDRAYGTSWQATAIRLLARWCGAYVSGGGTFWRRPDQGRSMWAAWREDAAIDRSFEIAGLRGWRRRAGEFPTDPDAAIAAALTALAIPDEERTAYLYRLLGTMFGWASALRRTTWEQGSDDPGPLRDLLAILAVTDSAIAALAPRTVGTASGGSPAAVEPVVADTFRAVLQEALEAGFVRALAASLAPPPTRSTTRADAQAVFCIDVRSEPFRRNLEAQSPSIQTLGFAGFFGVALAWNTADGLSPRCPVLLKPGLTVDATGPRTERWVGGAKREIQSAPSGAFTFVELLGLGYGIELVRDALASRPASTALIDEESRSTFRAVSGADAIPLADRVALAAGNLGLPEPMARVVLLCGHASHSANNPHAAGLDCGACGGHGGAINARVAAAVLNDPAVRSALREHGPAIPDDTLVVPGLHDTATDVITLLDREAVPASHTADVARLEAWLTKAGEATRVERAPALGLGHVASSALLSQLERKARDWSEVRPEWGLARNAGFLAARRERSRGANLDGRVFLHEYDWTRDPDNAVLTLILTAPVVVASWINLQYWASTIDNGAFGCGSKVLHNRIGSLGVVLGNGGDLRTGLPIQSVHSADGSWFHEPLRLQVMVEAPTERIDRVLRDHPTVRDLVEHGWIRLYALDPDGTTTRERLPGERWEMLTGGHGPVVEPKPVRTAQPSVAPIVS
jgi:uncharacterized protein YbcC (UPF0753/DUF2309 family)